MKITPEHFDDIRTHIMAVCDRTPGLAAAYQTMRSRLPLGIDGDRMFRWDLFWAARIDMRPLYAYSIDTHIDTALRAIMREVYPKYGIVPAPTSE